MRKFFFLLIFPYHVLFSQTTYFNIQFDYDSIWNASVGVTEADSFYLATGVFGSLTTFDTGFVIQISKQGLVTKLRKIDFFGGSKAFDIKLNSSMEEELDVFGIHHNGIDDVENVNLFLCRFTSNLDDTIKVKSFGFPGYGDYSYGPMLVSSDGGILVTGYRFALNQKGKLLLLKTDSSWNQVFMKTYSKSTLDNHEGWGVVETTDKGFIVVGGRSFNQYDRQGTYLKVDSLGNLLWWKDIVPQGDEEFVILDAITRLENGHYLIVGEKQVFTPGFSRYQLTLVVCIDETGEILWSKEFGDHKYNDVGWRGLTLCPDGNYITGGTRREKPSIPDRKAYGAIAKISPEGDLIWERLYSASTEGQLYDVFWRTIPTSDGGFICAGSTWGDSLTRENSWIVKLDSLGCLEPGCDSIVTGIIDLPVGENSPVKIYPNPTGGRFTVEARGGRLIEAVKIYDLQGRRLKDETYTPARESLSFDIGGAPPGAYFCTALVGGVWVTRQVVKH